MNAWTLTVYPELLRYSKPGSPSRQRISHIKQYQIEHTKEVLSSPLSNLKKESIEDEELENFSEYDFDDEEIEESRSSDQ